MKYIIFSIVFLVVSAFGCATNRNAMNAGSEEAYEQFKAVSDVDSVFATLEKTACFGKCPTFKFTIYNSGFAIYEGNQNVDRIGKFEAQISVAQMKQLIAVADSIGYMSFEKNYDNPSVTDLPSTSTSIVINGKRNAVRRRVDYPKSILSFEKALQAIIDETHWIEVKK